VTAMFYASRPPSCPKGSAALLAEVCAGEEKGPKLVLAKSGDIIHKEREEDRSLSPGHLRLYLLLVQIGNKKQMNWLFTPMVKRIGAKRVEM
jgi:hypothetical protein